MIREISITPIGMADTNIAFSGSFYDTDARTQVHLLENFVIVRDRPVAAHERIFQHNFSVGAPVWRMKWDDTDAKSKLQNPWIDQLKRHPLLVADGNPNLKKMLFLFENKDEVRKEKVHGIKIKLTVGNIINNLTIAEMRDAAYKVGLNPTSMPLEEIYVALIDFNSGALMKDQKTGLEFINNFKAEDSQFFVIGRKAILLGVISEDTSGMITINDTVVGKGMDNLIAYFKQHPEIYNNYVRKEVAKRDILTADHQKKVSEVLLGQKEVRAAAITSKEVVDTERLDATKALRDRARILGIKGWHKMYEKELTEAIAEKEQNAPPKADPLTIAE
jgi:hypothetical protein